jgi:hypothetical protein
MHYYNFLLLHTFKKNNFFNKLLFKNNKMFTIIMDGKEYATYQVIFHFLKLFQEK